MTIILLTFFESLYVKQHWYYFVTYGPLNGTDLVKVCPDQVQQYHSNPFQTVRPSYALHTLLHSSSAAVPF